MREIKFRGRCEKESRYAGEWVEGNLVQCEDGATLIVVAHSDNCTSTYHVDPDTVGQYTGLKDKKGKEIYDGDILAHNGEPFGYVVDGVRGYCFDVIHFSPEYEESWSLYGVVINDFQGDVEIAGNIHDSHKDRGALNLKNK